MLAMLSLHRLSKHFSGVPVFSEVSLQLQGGEFDLKGIAELKTLLAGS